MVWGRISTTLTSSWCAGGGVARLGRISEALGAFFDQGMDRVHWTTFVQQATFFYEPFQTRVGGSNVAEKYSAEEGGPPFRAHSWRNYDSSSPWAGAQMVQSRVLH